MPACEITFQLIFIIRINNLVDFVQHILFCNKFRDIYQLYTPYLLKSDIVKFDYSLNLNSHKN